MEKLCQQKNSDSSKKFVRMTLIAIRRGPVLYTPENALPRRAAALRRRLLWRAPFTYGASPQGGPRLRSATAPRLRPANVPQGPFPGLRSPVAASQALSCKERAVCAGSALGCSLREAPLRRAPSVRAARSEQGVAAFPHQGTQPASGPPAREGSRSRGKADAPPCGGVAPSVQITRGYTARGALAGLTPRAGSGKIGNPRWGSSSAGRAPRSQRGGRGFKSLLLHHLFFLLAWPLLPASPGVPSRGKMTSRCPRR